MKIVDIAYALPSQRVSNEDLISKVVDSSRKHLPEPILKCLEEKMLRFFRISGTQVRYHRKPDEKAVDFGLKAGREVLKRSGMRPEDVDLLIYTGVGKAWIEPATANLFQSQLGLRNATCFDIMDACASWMRSVSVAKSLIDQGSHKTVMVLNCEFNTREYTPFELKSPNDLEHYFSGYTIGEAATATLLTDDGDPTNGLFSFRTYGEMHDLCKISLPSARDFAPQDASHRLRPMSFVTWPAELLSFTKQRMFEHFPKLPDTFRKFDIVFGHSVSKSVTRAVSRILDLAPEDVYETHSRFGNTVSATLPLGMSVAAEEGRLQRGMQVLLAMGSSGVSTAFGTFKY